MDVEQNKESHPKSFRLFQNYPNPFNPTTTIRFTLPVSGFTTLKVFDILGREVAMLVNEEKSVGEHLMQWNGAGTPSGIYFYRLQSGNYSATKKLLLLK